MTDANMKTVVLGPEYDQCLRDVLKEVLQNLGAAVSNHFWGLAGSQELETLQLEVQGQRLTVEAETYIGLSLTGPTEIVDVIQQMVLRRIAKTSGEHT